MAKETATETRGGRGKTAGWIVRIGGTIAGVAACAVAALLIAAELGERKMQRRIPVDIPAVAVPEDPQRLERGRYLYMSRGCGHCHSTDGSGATVVDDGNGLLVKAPNISPSGVVAGYRVPDWTRAIRHGIKPDGRPVMIMPSEDYNRLTDDDLGALIAFLRQMAPAQGQAAVVQLPLMVKVLYGIGAIKDAAEKIDHRLTPAGPVPEGVSAQHGAYVANACIGCHGPKLQGGRIPGGPPDWPPASDLRPGGTGPMKAYADAEAFAAMFKTGKRPDGSEVSAVMPFASLKEMNEIDVRALYVYLRSLPSRDG